MCRRAPVPTHQRCCAEHFCWRFQAWQLERGRLLAQLRDAKAKCERAEAALARVTNPTAALSKLQEDSIETFLTQRNKLEAPTQEQSPPRDKSGVTFLEGPPKEDYFFPENLPCTDWEGAKQRHTDGPSRSRPGQDLGSFLEMGPATVSTAYRATSPGGSLRMRYRKLQAKDFGSQSPRIQIEGDTWVPATPREEDQHLQPQTTEINPGPSASSDGWSGDGQHQLWARPGLAMRLIDMAAIGFPEMDGRRVTVVEQHADGDHWVVTMDDDPSDEPELYGFAEENLIAASAQAPQPSPRRQERLS